ncbi:hypothetical protein PMAYCL1PPCAC_00735, partial [Pristionchus mayeri]
PNRYCKPSDILFFPVPFRTPSPLSHAILLYNVITRQIILELSASQKFPIPPQFIAPRSPIDCC